MDLLSLEFVIGGISVYNGTAMLDELNPMDLRNIQDEKARQLIACLLNLVEAISADLR